MSGTDLTKADRERVVLTAFIAHHVAEQRTRGGPNVTWDRLAERYQTYRATMINVVNKGTLVNHKIVVNVADELFRGSRDKLLAAAEKFWNTPEADRWRELLRMPKEVDARYPERSRAIYLARMAEVDERAIRTIMELGMPGKQRPTVKWWLTRILNEDRSYEVDGVATPPKAGSR